MFRVEKIHEHAVTNFIDLLNLETGTQDKCFDDSALKGMECFEFLEEGKVYDCKIELLDGFESEKTETNVEIKIIDSNAIVGNTKYWKVAIGQDVYYVPLSQTEGVDLNGRLYYDIMRKDLIQVDNVIHADCL